MRSAAFAIAVSFAALFAITTLSRSRQREALALKYFSVEDVARGRQFSLENRLIFWSAQAVELVVLLSLVRFAPRLADACSHLAAGRWALALFGVGALCFVAQELASFPLSVYGGLHHLKAWGLTDRSFGSWLSDHLKALLVGAAIGTLLLYGLYGLMRLLPRLWWVPATLGATLFAVFLAYLAPLVIAPLFNTFTALGGTKHALLLPRIAAMAEAAGLRVKDVLVMDASRQGRHTNAYFTGFGPTRRIVLYDTLLRNHTPEETLSVLAHELGHWRHDHIVKGIALGSVGALLGFLALARILEWASAAGRFGFHAASDPASLPLILLLSYLGGWVAAPVQNAVSRRFEREADRSALELGGEPAVFVAAEKRLVRDNISNVAPSDVNVLLFATHPPALERIRMAEAWAERAGR